MDVGSQILSWESAWNKLRFGNTKRVDYDVPVFYLYEACCVTHCFRARRDYRSVLSYCCLIVMRDVISNQKRER